MKSTALVLIDIQNDYFENGKNELVNPKKALMNTQRILAMFREHKLPVIHVQHVSNYEGATFFLPDTEGVKIHKVLNPIEGEYHIIKNYPNSFYKTQLNDILKREGVSDVVICGMMTHMCVDTTVRAAKDYELNITLIEDACATKDLLIHDTVIPADTVQNTYMASLNGVFAKIVKTDELKIVYPYNK